MSDIGDRPPSPIAANKHDPMSALHAAAVKRCCSKCTHYLAINDNDPLVKASDCWLCCGLWGVDNENLRKAIVDACEPYGGISQNRFAERPNQTHTITVSGCLQLRFQWLSEHNTVKDSLPNYLRDLKQHLHDRIQSILGDGSAEAAQKEDWTKEHPRVYEEEEQGALSIHVLCVPPKDCPVGKTVHDFCHTILESRNQGNKKKKKIRYGKRQKCGPFVTQGGDPRQNLEERLRSKGYTWLSPSESEGISRRFACDLFADGIAAVPRMEYQIAVFRRPMVFYGYYTKSRRDVSQTPFVVMREITNHERHYKDDENENEPTQRTTKRAETLGLTSVEEQICGPIRDLLGISTLNNLDNDDNSSSGGGVVYGMIKFHASGREDMDVRMLVRKSSESCHGRPFCVQIIDALNPITCQDQLEGLMDKINHSSSSSSSATTTTNTNELAHGVHYYGHNPLGVGISPNTGLRPVPQSVFSGLQGDTESKTKHYGCHCWSQTTLPPAEDLTSHIFQNEVFPLHIHQKTPLRVLHRRTNAVRHRKIFHAKATRIDDHHFRLEVSAEAGTYIKEFVYGDFGRTQPSVASLLKCKTNLLLLDCEGIEIPPIVVDKETTTKA